MFDVGLWLWGIWGFGNYLFGMDRVLGDEGLGVKGGELFRSCC